MAEKFLIQGNIPLSGEVEISGYKNAAGAVLAATLLTKEECQIDNLPKISDILDLIEILKEIGAETEWQTERKIKIKAENINPEKIPFNLFEKTRVSALLIGPLLARLGSFKVPHPGGDKIGLRPITTHLEALKNLGINIKEEDGFYFFEAPKKIKGKKIVLREFSVTATENLMMAAALSEGVTKIEIAAAEPQVQDLGNFLKEMGLKIEGTGTHSIKIEGVEKLSGASFSICPDLLEAGTFLLAFAVTNGEGKVKNINPRHLTMFLAKLKDIGVNYEIGENEILINPCSGFRATKIQVLPYPGFPTDLQPQISVLLTQAQGKSLIHDPLYENRFSHLHELRKMGADIEITDPHRALIFGKSELQGTKVDGNDIRSGAALILAGLAAKGKTIISNASQIDRGYEKIEGKLKKLGARIERIKE
ncbi:UDP-N-acetylglucosamine 1-carboxyvinyltransferase [Patescibacteria group bacterium]